MDLYRTEIVGSRVNLLRPDGTLVFCRANTPENRDLFETYAKRFNDKIARVDEYGYEKRGRNGNIVYPMTPVIEHNKWYAAYIIGNGYSLVSPVPCDNEENCKKSCEAHNSFYGWSEKEVDKIKGLSMFGKYKVINK